MPLLSAAALGVAGMNMENHFCVEAANSRSLPGKVGLQQNTAAVTLVSVCSSEDPLSE